MCWSQSIGSYEQAGEVSCMELSIFTITKCVSAIRFIQLFIEYFWAAASRGFLVTARFSCCLPNQIREGSKSGNFRFWSSYSFTHYCTTTTFTIKTCVIGILWKKTAATVHHSQKQQCLLGNLTFCYKIYLNHEFNNKCSLHVIHAKHTTWQQHMNCVIHHSYDCNRCV